MLRFPCRCAVVVLAATAYDTTPLPVPPPPAVMVNHAAPLVAVHAQPLTAVTVTLPFDAPPPTDTLPGEIDELHGDVNANVLELGTAPGAIRSNRGDAGFICGTGSWPRIEKTCEVHSYLAVALWRWFPEVRDPHRLRAAHEIELEVVPSDDRLSCERGAMVRRGIEFDNSGVHDGGGLSGGSSGEGNDCQNRETSSNR